MDLLELFEDKYLPAVRRIRSATTVDKYYMSIRQFADALGYTPTIDDLTDIALIKFERYLDSRGNALATIRGKIANLKALWNWAAKKRIVEEFPTLDPIRVPPQIPRAWTEDEVIRLLAAAKRFPGDSPYLERDYGGIPCGQYWYVFIRTALETGERPGALFEARWEHLDVSRGILDLPGSIRKGGIPKQHPLRIEVLQLLEDFRHEYDLIFPWFRKNHQSRRNHYKYLLQFAGLPHGRKDSFHKLRRTHLTWWAARGGNATERAGHSSPKVTKDSYLDPTQLPREEPEKFLPQIPSETIDAFEFDDGECNLGTCQACGKQFRNPRRGTKYCSDQCRRIANYLNEGGTESYCEACGKPFRTLTRNRKFCSDKCRDAVHAARKRKSKKPSLPAPKPSKTCEVCGQSYTPKRSDAKYCGHQCSQKAYHRRRKVHTDSDDGRKPRVELSCQVCGTSFTPKRSDGKYCSSQCCQKAYDRRKRQQRRKSEGGAE